MVLERIDTTQQATTAAGRVTCAIWHYAALIGMTWQ
jgi:hypothetical protein